MKAFLLFSVIILISLFGCQNTDGSPGPVPEQVLQSAPGGFQVPHYTAAEQKEIFEKYSYISGDVPKQIFQQALLYYQYNLSLLPNRDFISLVDFTKYSGVKRLWIINMKTGQISQTYVAHGIGSDPSHTGYAKKFSNTLNSYESSLGFYLMNETTTGKNGLTLLLYGLSQTNSNARERGIEMHGADYVYDKPVKQGRSEGCFALPLDQYVKVINQLKGGTLLFAWSTVPSG